MPYHKEKIFGTITQARGIEKQVDGYTLVGMEFTVVTTDGKTIIAQNIEDDNVRFYNVGSFVQVVDFGLGEISVEPENWPDKFLIFIQVIKILIEKLNHNAQFPIPSLKNRHRQRRQHQFRRHPRARSHRPPAERRCLGGRPRA